MRGTVTAETVSATISCPMPGRRCPGPWAICSGRPGSSRRRKATCGSRPGRLWSSVRHPTEKDAIWWMRPPFSVSTMPCGGGCCWSCWGTCRLRGRTSCPYMSGTLWPCSREKGTDISPCLLASRPGGSTVRWCWSAWRRRSGQERPRPGMYSRPGGRSPRRCF